MLRAAWCCVCRIPTLDFGTLAAPVSPHFDVEGRVVLCVPNSNLGFGMLAAPVSLYFDVEGSVVLCVPNSNFGFWYACSACVPSL